MAGARIIDELDKGEINNFAVEHLHLVGSLVEAKEMVWHYTNGSALISILESMSMFATNISCLNDSSELSYARDLYRHAILEFSDSVAKDDRVESFLRFALDYLGKGRESSQSSPFFIACFSEERDDLSQWRAYGGENGYAIGFKAGELVVPGTAPLTRVCYDAQMHDSFALRAAETMTEFYLEGLESHSPCDVVQWQHEFMRTWDGMVTMMIAATMKNPAFSKEREVRVTKRAVPGDLQNLRFLQKNNMMTRHLPLRFSSLSLSPTLHYRLPISEIIIGPCRNPLVSKASVVALLAQKGYEAVNVSLSQIPLRPV